MTRDNDYPLPQNIDAEQAVLGSILLKSDVILKVLEILSPVDFYKDAHCKIYNAMIHMYRDKSPIDVLTLFEHLKSKGNLLEEVGESSYLTYLMELVPTSENAEYYAKIVKEKSYERKICIEADRISHNIKTGKITFDQAREKLNATYEELRSIKSKNKLFFEDSSELIKEDNTSQEWYIKDFIPKASIVLITASPGAYKTWMALYVSNCIAKGSLCLGKKCNTANVYYIDKENPKGLLIDRLNKIGASKNLKIYGTWNEDEAPNLDSDISSYRSLAEDNTVIVFDSLIRFHTGEENSSNDMSKVFGSLRALTSKGATVILIHHKGKSDYAYRGSSDILAGVDICFSLDKKNEVLEFSCKTKNRYAQPYTLSLEIEESESDFEFLVSESPQIKQYKADILLIREIIKDITDEGINPIQGKIVDIAKENTDLSNNRIRKLLDSGTGSYWSYETGSNNAKIYRLISNAETSNLADLQQDEAVMRFLDSIPPEKPENRKTNINYRDEIDTL